MIYIKYTAIKYIFFTNIIKIFIFYNEYFHLLSNKKNIIYQHKNYNFRKTFNFPKFANCRVIWHSKAN
jgi:hypothetical protein